MTTPATEPPLDTGAYQALFDASPKTTKVVTLANLTRVGARPPLRQYIALLWARRNFLWRDARARVGSNSRESVLGKLWLILEPVINGLTYYLVFGVIMGGSRGITNFLGYLVIGVFLFQFTIKCTTGGTRAVTSNTNMIRAFTFPRAALPIAVVLREVLSYLWTLAALAALIYVLPEQETFTWRVALVPVVLVLQVMFTLGLALFLARWTVAIRDLATIVPLVSRIWLYASCVFFSFDTLEDRGLPPIYGAVMQYNPMFQVLDMVRDLVLYATIPDLTSWLILGGWAVGMLVVGFVSFWWAEESYGR